MLLRKPGRSIARPIVKPGSRFGKRSFITPEIRARNEKLNDAMSKVVQSMDYDTKEGDDKLTLKRGIKKVSSNLSLQFELWFGTDY